MLYHPYFFIVNEVQNMCPQEQELKSLHDQCNWKNFLSCILDGKSHKKRFYLYC